MDEEQVDILLPPLFTPSGEVKSRTQAYKDGDWTGAFNMWIFTRDPVPSIIYQQRGPNVGWAPGLLDVTAAGQLQSGEKLTDGLREVDEELGKHYTPDQVMSLGRKLYVGFNSDGTSRNNIIDIYMIEDTSSLGTYRLDAQAVYAICACPVADLLQAHRDKSFAFDAQGLTASGEAITISVSKKSFPENWDDYHYKIAVLADRYFKGEKLLMF